MSLTLNEWSSDMFTSNSSPTKIAYLKVQIPLNVVILNLTDDFISKGVAIFDIPLARIVRYSKKKDTRIRDESVRSARTNLASILDHYPRKIELSSSR